ncbi:hypothetical protein MHC_00955 [Mycoplasma haemocanis str. Illinois]|uniref:Uncharacterized protein n=1 Tax=Mycoplasma haemocanis (strain Illinois) TaxID=1111676 RepID=H6N5U7_MYCHN|nr:hypothetical protein [Mycoplasma haemocanis]AEW45057.1 hypothetical protein MHC_00955 [Mycoplasma haemocanis str. Illinois]
MSGGHVSKNYSFLRRTLVLLSPLFLSTLISRELAFNSPSLSLNPLELDFDNYQNSALTLAKSLNSDLPEGTSDYGSLIVQKLPSGKEYWIDQISPFSNISHGKNYKFKTATTLDHSLSESLKIESDSSQSKYTLSKSNFEKANLSEVGDPNLLTVLDLKIPGGQPIQLTHVIPLVDLVSNNSKDYHVVKIESKDETQTQTQTQTQTHTLKLTKDNSKQQITIEITNNSQSTNLSNLAIRSFYVLFNDNPPIDLNSYFSEQSNSGSSVYSPYPNRGRKIFLDKWSSSSSSSSGDAQYSFSTSSDFWKSTCQDPYKVGGFIDKKISSTSTSTSTTTSSTSTTGDSNIKKQLSSFREFRSQVGIKEKATQQYYYEQISEIGKYVPSSDYDEKSNTPCEKLDEVTKEKLKEYVKKDGNGKNLDRSSKIDEKLTPHVLGKEIDLTTQTQTQNTYPHHKLVQSSFRAFGNVYNSNSVSGKKIKEKGLYSQTFENALSSSHSFSIKIEKEKFKSKLLKHSNLEKNYPDRSNKYNELEDISTLLEVYYPISFTFYDPISNYLKKKNLYLKTELDLSYLYYQNSFSKEVFSYDIGAEHGEIGFDYGGFLGDTKKTSYGLSGTLKFYAGLYLDKDKNLHLDLTSKVKGFVNTKNPSCDLRHRLYKINNNNNNELSEDLKCSKDGQWTYRDYIHIPSYLVISLEREPEISSFYIDRQIGITSTSSTEVKTLKKFEEKLEERQISKVVYTDPSNDGEVYFQNLAAYDESTRDTLKLSTQVSSSSWFSINHQYLYYYEPLKQTNEIDLSDKESLESIKISVSGAKTTLSKFFHSSHFNTKRVVCTTSTSASQSHSKDCGDGKKYEKEEKDKTPSEISAILDDQDLTVNYDDIKNKNNSSNSYEIRFRMVINRAYDPDSKTKDSNDFSSNKDKYEKIFKDDSSDVQQGEESEIPGFSCLAVWYSLELWIEESKLKYTTKLRAISLVSKPIQNSTAHLVSGAAGSAGFEISKFEFKYKNGAKK